MTSLEDYPVNMFGREGYVIKPNVVFGLINLASALLIMGVSLPLVKRKIKMNQLYGVRIKKSFESEDNWYKINAYGGKQLIIWSIPMLFAGLICFLSPLMTKIKIYFHLF